MTVDQLLRTKKFQEIIRFYLLECPVRYNSGAQVSSRGRTFKERGLEKNALTTLRAAMIRVSKIQLNTIKGDPVRPTGSKEFLIVRERSDMSAVNAYFYAVRNSLAHGSFNYEKGFYTLENRSKGKLQAIGEIHEKTLLRWIELCEKNVSELKKVRM